MTRLEGFIRCKFPQTAWNVERSGVPLRMFLLRRKLEFPPRRQDTRRVLTFSVMCSPYSPFRIHSTLGEEARGVPPSARSTHARMQQGENAHDDVAQQKASEVSISANFVKKVESCYFPKLKISFKKI